MKPAAPPGWPRLFLTGNIGTCRVSCRVAKPKADRRAGLEFNPGRYVGVAPGQKQEDEEFRAKLEALQEDLEELNAEAAQLQARIAQNVAELLEG